MPITFRLPTFAQAFALTALSVTALIAAADLARSQSLPPGAQAAAAACRPDIARLCPGVQPGGGRLIACLRTNADALSPTCRTAMEQAQATRAGRGGAPVR